MSSTGQLYAAENSFSHASSGVGPIVYFFCLLWPGVFLVEQGSI